MWGSFTLTIDVTAPNPPTVSAATPTSDTTPTWTWTTGGGGGNGTFRYQLDSTAGAWTVTGSGLFAPVGPLSDGPHILYVEERDAASNWSAWGSFMLTIDATGPNPPTVSGPPASTDRTPTWTWATGGGGGNGTFRYQLDSTAGAWTVTTAHAFTPVAPLSIGVHTLYVQERDPLGNWSNSGSRGVMVFTPSLRRAHPMATV